MTASPVKAKLIDGKAVATKVTAMKNQGIAPGLAVVLVGEDAASLSDPRDG